MEKFKIYYLYLTVFLTGLTVLIIEILGTRILAPFFGSTIFVWSALISVTLAMLAVGYWLGGRLADKRPQADLLYLLVLFSGLTIILIPKYSQPVLFFSDRYGLKFGPLAAAFFLFSLPLFFLGAVSPFAVKLKVASGDVGNAVGLVFALATIGSLAGALLAGYVLIPLLPLSVIFKLNASALTIASLVGLSLLIQKKKVILGLFLLALFFFLLSGYKNQDSGGILFQRQSFYGDIKIARVGPYTCIYVDAIAQSCLRDDRTTDAIRISQIDKLVKANGYKKFLILGMAGGSVLSVLPAEADIKVVEIDPAVVETAKQFNLIPSRGYRIVYDDARHFLLADQEEYDLIVFDLAQGASFPAYMFTREALASLKDRLTSSGALFINIMDIDPAADRFLFSSIYRTIRQVFSEQIVFVAPADGRVDLLNLIAAKKLPALPDGLSIISAGDLPPERDGKLLSDDFLPIQGVALSFLERTVGSKDLNKKGLYLAK